MIPASQSPSTPMSAEQSGIAGTAATPTAKLSAAAVEWAQYERRLSRKTLVALGVASGIVHFPQVDRKHEALFFKFMEGWKARSIQGKHHVAGGGFKASFWNLENVLRCGREVIWITEGELDACALVEAGIHYGSVLSVPNGAREKPTIGDPLESGGYGYVAEALRQGLSRVKRVIWCGDDDGPGHALRADMVRIFGAARFYFVTWPEGCKDAGDLLKFDGPEALFDLVTEGYLPWPVEGLYRLSELPEPPPLELWYPGFPEWERKVMLAPKTLSVATGHPGHGKTAFFNQMWYQVSKRYDVGVCIASFETRAKPHIRRQLRSLYSGKLEMNMSEVEMKQADDWINQRYLFVATDTPTLATLLDAAEVAVVRHGCKVVMLDPWNRLESARDGASETETDYIGRCLRTIHSFAHDMGCHFMILAHPAKTHATRRDMPPDLADISGSKNWDNAVDQGFVIYREKLWEDGVRQTDCLVQVKKARFEELGYPCNLGMKLNLISGRFESTDYPRV